MATPPRRLHARYLCRLPVRIAIPAAKDPVEATALNVGMGGAYLRVRGPLKITALKLEIVQERSVVALDARVVRNAGVDPKDSKFSYYGVEFASDDRTLQRVRMLVDRVRSGSNATTGTSLPMANYWNL